MVHKGQSKLFIYIYSTLFIVATGCSSVSNPDAAVNELEVSPGLNQAQVDSIFRTLSYFPNETQFAIAVFSDTSAMYYGAIRRQDTVRTIDNYYSVFEIGSISKVFTSVLLADLVQKNRVQLDQPIQDHLDFQLNDSLQTTFKQLANHSSGLPRVPPNFVWESLLHMDNPYKDYDETKLREYMREDMVTVREPGNSFRYSNIGAGMLGYVLTRVSGESYETMLQQRVFTPLDMQHSTTVRTKVEELLVDGLTKRGNIATKWDFDALKGAGAILSTAEDLAKFGRAHFDMTLPFLQLPLRSTNQIDETREVGLGWMISKRNSTDRWHWHNGGTGGYRSSIALNIADNKGVVILSNISSGHTHSGKIDLLNFFLLEEKKAEEKNARKAIEN